MAQHTMHMWRYTHREGESLLKQNNKLINIFCGWKMKHPHKFRGLMGGESAARCFYVFLRPSASTGALLRFFLARKKGNVRAQNPTLACGGEVSHDRRKGARDTPHLYMYAPMYICARASHWACWVCTPTANRRRAMGDARTHASRLFVLSVLCVRSRPSVYDYAVAPLLFLRESQRKTNKAEEVQFMQQTHQNSLYMYMRIHSVYNEYF